jgi:hypothetical protein
MRVVTKNILCIHLRNIGRAVKNDEGQEISTDSNTFICI